LDDVLDTGRINPYSVRDGGTENPYFTSGEPLLNILSGNLRQIPVVRLDNPLIESSLQPLLEPLDDPVSKIYTVGNLC
jgi:hypothetical protein